MNMLNTIAFVAILSNLLSCDVVMTPAKVDPSSTDAASSSKSVTPVGSTASTAPNSSPSTSSQSSSTSTTPATPSDSSAATTTPNTQNTTTGDTTGGTSTSGARKVLFIRGGSGTGGFIDGGTLTQRDEELADITNTSTNGGNHGWGEWAAALRSDGFTVEQILEGQNSKPIDFASMDLTPYAVIVLGSNNAHYEAAAVSKVQDWIKAGGGLLTVSDGNFGNTWGAAPSSDTDFLQAFGVIVNQDGGTYTLQRSSGDFLVSNHPILNGVNAFDGEGVSPCTITSQVSGVTAQVIVRAQGTKHLNTADGSSGGSANVTSSDGSLVVGTVGKGRFACTYDRNTFFNANGVGSNVHKNDNLTYGRNLIAWLAGKI